MVLQSNCLPLLNLTFTALEQSDPHSMLSSNWEADRDMVT